MCATPHRPDRDRGFTLVELVIVILVLAILVGVAAPRLMDTAAIASEQAFANELMALVDTAERYRASSGKWPSDGNTGVAPIELQEVVSKRVWKEPTPLGGAWDTEMKDNGVTFAVGAVFTSVPTDSLIAVDTILDDGSLNTGNLRLLDTGRYYYVLDP